MIIHKCKCCNFETTFKYKYDKHLLTKKHLNIANSNKEEIGKEIEEDVVEEYTNNKYMCNICEFNSQQKCDYDRHIKTQKHKNNKIMIQQIELNTNDKVYVKVDKVDILIKQNETVLKQNEDFKKHNETVISQNEELRKKIEMLEKSNQELKDTNNQNTNKIVKEARGLKKSILTILNTNFRDTPSIDYIQEDEFKRELEAEYKAKINDKENKLFMRIFSDYENKKLVKSISDIILKIVKKEDKKSQSVFNIDSSRGNYATKIEDCWFNDKSGLQLKKYTLEMVIKYMINVLDKFRLKLVQVREENMKNSTREKSDFIMKYQSILLEVIAFLTNSNTHKKIILHMCPELRMDQKLLESIENEL